MTNYYAIITAGGSGTRIGSAIPKQFIIINGKPILLYTIEKFLASKLNIKIVLVLPKNSFKTWETILENTKDKEYYKANNSRISMVVGGETRFLSVQNGLNSIKEEGLVAVHDGARPYISTKIIENTYKVAAKSGSAVCSVSSTDSVRIMKGEKNESVDRNKIKLIQTPQTFPINEIKKAFLKADHSNFTDEASVYESAGKSIELVDGSYQNIKITTPIDLNIAEICLK